MPKTTIRGTKGKRGEDAAVAFLMAGGYEILVRNYRVKLGEIDIVARDGDCYVFAEVKTAVSGRTDPRLNFDAKKFAKIRKAAFAYLSEETDELDPAYRFDLIAVYLEDDNVRVDHYPGVTVDNYE
jgi:putative endonuclease